MPSESLLLRSTSIFLLALLTFDMYVFLLFPVFPTSLPSLVQSTMLLIASFALNCFEYACVLFSMCVGWRTVMELWKSLATPRTWKVSPPPSRNPFVFFVIFLLFFFFFFPLFKETRFLASQPILAVKKEDFRKTQDHSARWEMLMLFSEKRRDVYIPGV